MPDLNDFYAFKSTSSGSGSSGRGNNNSNGSGGNEGCASVMLWVAAILSLLWIIGTLFG